jgi:hypothetical protein
MDGVLVLLLFAALVVGLVVWLWRTFGRSYMQQAERAEAERRTATSAVPSVPSPALEFADEDVTVATLDFGNLRVSDLRGLPSTDLRVVGSSYWISYEERERLASDRYYLVREPENEHDANAVAVYSMGRKVGHLSAVKAEAYAPLLDRLGADAFLVGGTSREGKSALVILVPRVPELRRL